MTGRCSARDCVAAWTHNQGDQQKRCCGARRAASYGHGPPPPYVSQTATCRTDDETSDTRQGGCYAEDTKDEGKIHRQFDAARPVPIREVSLQRQRICATGGMTVRTVCPMSAPYAGPFAKPGCAIMSRWSNLSGRSATPKS